MLFLLVINPHVFSQIITQKYFIKSVIADKHLDVKSGQTANGTPFHLWSSNNYNSSSNNKNTAFSPDKHGFNFVNRFANHRFFGPINVNFGGRCAGMVYSALDYFYKKKSIPQQTKMPVEGSVLSSYISRRQENSLTSSNIRKIQELNVNLFGRRTMEYFKWGIQGFDGGRLEEVVQNINKGKPIPITLFDPTGDLINYPHHVVLVIGYNLGKYPMNQAGYDNPALYKEIELYVYDPNYPNQKKILKPYYHNRNPRFRYSNGGGKNWLTYFIHADYKVTTPPSNKSPNVGDDCPSKKKNIVGKSFRGQNLSNKNYRCVIAKAVDFYGATINQTDFYRGNLEKAIFTGANLRNSNFTLANAQSSSFHGADLKVSVLEKANLQYASFYGADLKNSKCAGADFRNANIEGTDFRNADLRNADFRGAKRSNHTNFSGANLAGVKGL